jgi:hypothetical protein
MEESKNTKIMLKMIKTGQFRMQLRYILGHRMTKMK